MSQVIGLMAVVIVADVLVVLAFGGLVRQRAERGQGRSRPGPD